MTLSFNAAAGSKVPRGLGLTIIAITFALANFSAPAALQVTTAPGFGPYHVEAGEMTMIGNPAVAGMLGGYSSQTKNFIQPGSFQTFCLEREEYITPNTTYEVTLSDITVFTGQKLTRGAAFLYQQFATGQLKYNYSDTPAGSRRLDNSYNAYYLQHAIWYFMGEYSKENHYYVNLVLGSISNPFAPDNGEHNVYVMNLWKAGQPHDASHAYQDILIYQPVPETTTVVAGLLLLIPLGVSVVRVLRAKRS